MAGGMAGGRHGNGITVTALLVGIDTLKSVQDVAERAVTAAGIKQSRSTFWTKEEQSLVSTVRKIEANIEKLLGELKTEQRVHADKSKAGLRGRMHGHSDTIKNLEASIAATELALDVAREAAAAPGIGDAPRSQLCEAVEEYERELPAMYQKLNDEVACNASKSANGTARMGSTRATGPGAVCLKAMLKIPVDGVPFELPLRGTRKARASNSSLTSVATTFYDRGVNKYFFRSTRELSRRGEGADFSATSFGSLVQVVSDDNTKMWVPGVGGRGALPAAERDHAPGAWPVSLQRSYRGGAQVAVYATG
jgi:hypothetical protein